MSEAKVDRNWLLRYDILRQVNQCRRLIQAEFGEKPLLNDPALRELLAGYAGRSRSKALQRCYAEMRLMLIELEGQDLVQPEVVEPVNVRMYRGRPVAAPDRLEPAGGEAQESVTAPPATTKTIVYRGRVMQVA